MSFYLRKSISVGPFRFNLSKSGVGVSAGVAGLRIGTSPRGNYIHMGRGGLYYRATLPSSPSPHNPSHHLQSPSASELPSGTHAPLREIESADVSQIVDSSSRELLEELNRKREKIRFWPFAAVITITLLALGIHASWPAWLVSLIVITGAIGIYAAHTRDALQKTVVLLYDFDSEMEHAYARFHSAASQVANCASAWHIESSGKVHDRKYHAGASSLIDRKQTSIRKAAPPYVKTNIETIAVDVGRQTLHFFPDRVLIYDKKGVGAVGYQELHVKVATTRFIESESVPRDAKVVDRTWKYVNKSGGPDKRFKDNKELPICQYEEVALMSKSGLNEVIQLSRCGSGIGFSEAISSLAKNIQKESPTRPAA